MLEKFMFMIPITFFSFSVVESFCNTIDKKHNELRKEKHLKQNDVLNKPDIIMRRLK